MEENFASDDAYDYECTTFEDETKYEIEMSDSDFGISDAAQDDKKDNGSEAGGKNDGEKKDEDKKKPAVATDAEDDEHDLIAMPSVKMVQNDLKEINKRKRYIIHTLSIDDLNNPRMKDLMRNPACSEINVQFSRRSDGKQDLVGVMSILFSSTKAMSTFYSAMTAIRKDFVIDNPPSDQSTDSILEKWKKEHSVENKNLPSTMVIVKNVDPSAATIDQLSAIFPEADDIAVSSQPQANYLGKLKGSKHAYLAFGDKNSATAVIDKMAENPIVLNDRQLIVGMYKEPPHHVPEGYLRLTTRKLVLTQIARARGLIARAQEDPTYELPAHWNKWLEAGQQIIAKDDKARDVLGLPKPMLADFKDLNLKFVILQKSAAAILFNLGIGENPAGSSNNTNRKRPNYSTHQPPAKSAPAVSKKPPSLFSARPRTSAGPRMRGTIRRGFGTSGYGAYNAMPPRPGSFPLPSPARLAMRARARNLAQAYMEDDYMGWLN